MADFFKFRRELEEAKCGKNNKREEKLDPVGKADADIDNDGDVDSSDEYLKKRRKAISKAMKKEDDGPCWDGYVQVGTKKKNGKEVPNCVPMEEARKRMKNENYRAEKGPDDLKPGDVILYGRDDTPHEVISRPKQSGPGYWVNIKNLSTNKKDRFYVDSGDTVPMNEQTSYEDDIDPNKKIVVKGVKGMNSKSFTKKFRNMKAADKWMDDNEDDIEVKQVMNEETLSEGYYDYPDYGPIGASEMAQTQLQFIKYAADDITRCLNSGCPMPEWYQNKLAKMEGEMEGLYSYMKGKTRKMKARQSDRYSMGMSMYGESTLTEAKSGDKDAYRKFFNKALKKFGVKSQGELEGEKEKEFYDYIDKNWKSDKEKNESTITEVLKPSDDVSKWIEDFRKSDAPQFEGKDNEERREMAVAAWLSAREEAGIGD